MLGDNHVAEVKVPVVQLDFRGGQEAASEVGSLQGVQGQRAVNLAWRLRLDVLPKSRRKGPYRRSIL